MRTRNPSPVLVLCLAAAAGLTSRLLLAWLVPPAGDIGAWHKFSTYFQSGLSPYDASNRYNYTPVWFWVITAVSFVVHKTGLPFAFAIRLPIILGDLGIFALLAASGRRRGAALFFLNPVSVFTSGMYGQFDNLSLIFVLFAVLCRDRTGPKFFGLAVSAAVKHFTLLLAPVFALSEKTSARKVTFLLCAPLLFFASFIPYAANAPHILRNVFGYNLHAGYWGWSGLITRGALFFGADLKAMPWFHYLDVFNSFLYAGIFAASFWIAKRMELDRAVVAVFLIFYAFTTQISPQYTVWILPFAALRPNRWFTAYALAGGVQVAAFYYCHYHWSQMVPIEGTIPCLMPKAFVVFRYLTWAVCVGWLAGVWREASKVRSGSAGS